MKPASRRAIAALAVLVPWALACVVGWPSRRAMPTLGDFAATVRIDLVSAPIWLDVGATLARVIAGTLLSAPLGAAIGLALGSKTSTWRASQSVVDFVRAVPPILTFPLFLLALGYGEPARVGAIVLGTVGIVVLPVAAALDRAPRERREAVTLAGIRGVRAFAILHVHEALPAFFTAVRVALAAALVIAVVSEMLVGADHGLGARALEAQLAYRADLLWLVIFLAGGVGWGLSAAVSKIERRVVHWR